jgi:hypothetical protein
MIHSSYFKTPLAAAPGPATGPGTVRVTAARRARPLSGPSGPTPALQLSIILYYKPGQKIYEGKVLVLHSAAA